MSTLLTREIDSPLSKAISFFVVCAIVSGVGYFSTQSIKSFPKVSTRIVMIKEINDKKIAMIVASRDFRDEEYFIPKQILEQAGGKIVTVSNQTGEIIGSEGGETKASLTLGEIKVSDFDAILFIGGQGAPKYLDNKTSYEIAKKSVSENKILGAICISPTILAKAGVLSGKKATVWSSLLNKKPIKVLEENGAHYQTESVVVDGNIITAEGPKVAERFAETVISLLE